MISIFHKYDRLKAYAAELEADGQIEKAKRVREIIAAEAGGNKIGKVI